ncbi:MAG: hypothetical protein M1469_12075 [Bacteroidetes bacterium]|nr:hypothetical protein [Bacteroidota bacterium]
MIQERKVDPLDRLLHNGTMRTLAVSLIAIAVISIILIWKYAGDGFGGAYFLGALLGVVNGAVGFYTIEKFIDQSSLVFLKGISLGMGIRLLLLLGIFILLIEVFKTPIIPLVTGLIVFYFTMTIFEVIFLNKRMAFKKTGKGTAQ